MKVIEDKVTLYPPHAICKVDVPVILSSLPPAWTEGIETVRLCSSQQWPLHRAFYSRFDHTLTICSRGLTKQQTIQATLTELAAHGLGLKFQRWHHLPQREAARVRRVIAPLVEEIVPQLSRKKVWLDK
ncbi:MAG: hypothetical protein IH623_00130 [Verrucomicrobia bacterium]|nr:hypothetical protein [Verrucomicrobiota bacterium]